MFENRHEAQRWQDALEETLVDAIAHLQTLIFDEGWDALRARVASDEDALRESVLQYERELARVFGSLRASGALPDAVAWSTLKTEFRRAALDAGTEISLRTAMETGFYAAESVPLADHSAYLDWASAVRSFLAVQVQTDPPGPESSVDDRLLWAYNTLAALEDHDIFSAAFVDWLAPSTPAEHAIVTTQQRLLELPRFDLFLNTSLRWLAMTHR